MVATSMNSPYVMLCCTKWSLSPMSKNLKNWIICEWISDEEIIWALNYLAVSSSRYRITARLWPFSLGTRTESLPPLSMPCLFSPHVKVSEDYFGYELELFWLSELSGGLLWLRLDMRRYHSEINFWWHFYLGKLSRHLAIGTSTNCRLLPSVSRVHGSHNATQEALWIRSLLKEFGFSMNHPLVWQ
jgi:hypothetical protein